MKIADLFVEIGVQGADKSIKAISGIKGGLHGVVDSSLAAKAAILAAVYAFERLTFAAGEHGAELEKYHAFTNQSIIGLQQWGNAFRQVGVSVEEVQSTMEGLQGAVAKLKMGDPAIARAFGWMADAGVKIDQNQIDNPEYLLQQAINYSKAESNTGRRNQVLAMLGFSPNMIQGAFRGIFDAAHKAIGGYLSEGEASQLNKVSVSWENIWQSIKMISEHQVAAHGLFAVNEISEALKLISALSNGLGNLAKQFPIIKTAGVAAILAINAALLAGGGPITALATAVVDLIYLMGELQKWREGKANIYTDISEIGTAFLKKYNLGDRMTPEEAEIKRREMNGIPLPTTRMEHGKGEKAELHVTNNYNQDVNDLQKTSETVKQSILSAYVQLPGFQNA